MTGLRVPAVAHGVDGVSAAALTFTVLALMATTVRPSRRLLLRRGWRSAAHRAPRAVRF